MAKYNLMIDTDNSPDNEAGIQEATAAYSLDKGVPFTAEEYLQVVLQLQVNALGQEFAKRESTIIAIKFEKADPQKRAEVKLALDAIEAAEANGELNK